MLCWYRRLLQLRKEIPAITEGRILCQEAQDDTGLIRITRTLSSQEVILLFCSKDTVVELPELAGKMDLLTNQVFDGHMNGITAVVLR